ncbi:hypothetical protein KSF78_0001217 [Schistosoma japonicum]|nr:hypothetical protein KSF78_0001217 [Schistosoma japonicum]
MKILSDFNDAYYADYNLNASYINAIEQMTIQPVFYFLNSQNSVMYYESFVVTVKYISIKFQFEVIHFIVKFRQISFTYTDKLEI